MMWYLSIYYVTEIESSLFSHISCLFLSLRLSFCLTLCHRGGGFYWVLEDSPKQWPSIWSLCMNTRSASQRSHTHHSWGFIRFPIVPISSDSSYHRADQETQRTALLLLISLKPATRTNQTHTAGTAECKVPRLAFQSGSPTSGESLYNEEWRGSFQGINSSSKCLPTLKQLMTQRHGWYDFISKGGGHTFSYRSQPLMTQCP